MKVKGDKTECHKPIVIVTSQVNKNLTFRCWKIFLFYIFCIYWKVVYDGFALETTSSIYYILYHIYFILIFTFSWYKFVHFLHSS